MRPSRKGYQMNDQMRLAAIALLIVILNTEAASTATRLAAARIINKDRRR